MTTTKRTETRVTGTHTDYQPVRPDRVSLPDLPHLYGSNGQLVGIDVWRGTEEIDWPTVKPGRHPLCHDPLRLPDDGRRRGL